MLLAPGDALTLQLPGFRSTLYNPPNDALFESSFDGGELVLTVKANNTLAPNEAFEFRIPASSGTTLNRTHPTPSTINLKSLTVSR
jgi:hypothetical protein